MATQRFVLGLLRDSSGRFKGTSGLGPHVKHVRLTLDADGREGEIAGMYDLLANASFVRRAETLHWNFSGDRIGIMHYVEGDAEAYRNAVESLPEVEDYELTRDNGDSFYAYQVCDVPEPARELFGALSTGRTIVIPPTEYAQDGTVSLSLLGTSGDLQAAIDDIPEPVEVDVHEITGLDRAANALESVLSERQRAVIDTALERGYYEIPREASHEDVAEAVGCAPSTAAEHLRKAESALVKSVLGR